MALAVSSPVAAIRSRRASLQPVDLLLLGYLAVVSVVALRRAPAEPECWWLLGAHALFLMLLALMTRPRLGRLGRTLREIYPLLLLVGLYGELDVLNGIGATVHDATVQRWELALFGAQVSRVWWQAAPSRFWSIVLHGAYFSYYLVVTLPALYFVARGDLRAVRDFVLAVMATFVTCYLVFLFFPVAGPYYVFPAPSAWFTDNLPARLVYRILANGSSYGAAFPSSHVAATVAAVLAARRQSTRLGLLLLIPTALLSVGVVYCQMHYAVDAVAGLLVGVAVPWAAQKASDPAAIEAAGSRLVEPQVATGP
jgi:membrane-associated phospholipid phosphatase